MSGERILVVDDSAQVRDFLARVILPTLNYVVDTARDGAEGVAAALAHSPDLIITDFSMPDMTGLEMVEELRKSNSMIPVILMTAEGSENIAVDALRLGVMDYFVKPFEPDELLNAVQRILRATRIGSVRAGVPDQSRLEALNSLIAIGKAVTSQRDLEMILSRVVEAAVFLAGAEEGTLMLVDPESGELYVRAAKNIEDGLRRSMRLPVQDSLAGRVIKTGKPLLVSEKGLQKIQTQYLVRSLLYVPLHVGDEVFGVLGVHNRTSERPISAQDVGVINALADYAAIAITNAQSFSRAEAERARLARVFQQMEDPLLVVDNEGRLVLSTPAALSLLDQAPPDASPEGRWLSDLTTNRSLIQLLNFAMRGQATRGEIDGADGQTFSAVISPVEGIGLAINLHDITSLKQSNQAKTDLIQMVSHQVRSPLTAILSYLEFLMRTGNLTESQLEFSYQVRHNVQLITDTINDLLNLGKVEAGVAEHQEKVSVESAARYAYEALRSRAEAKGQQIVFIADDVPDVVGNPVQLRQAFMNLVENAIKYTPEGGKVEIQIFKEGGQIVSCVSDSGIGIAPADQPRIFDKFYRAHDVSSDYEGTGLGLAIVKSIIDAHGGRIWVDSHIGDGTVFTVVLPVVEASGTEASVVAAES